MAAVSLEKLFIASKMQSYEDLDEQSLIAIFPHMYFTIENVECFVAEKFKDPAALITAVELLQFLDSLATVDIRKIWEITLLETSKKRSTELPPRSRVFTYDDFEAQSSVESKVKLVIQQLQHVLHENASDHCEYYRCCTLLEASVLLNIVTVIISAVIVGLYNTDILPDVIAGLSIHCALGSRLLIERLVLNFPEKWCTVYECLLERISTAKYNSDQKGASRCLAMLHHLPTFVPDINGLMNKCIQLRQLPNLVMQLAIMRTNSDKDFSLLNLFKRVLLDSGRKTQSWFAEYLRFTWDTSPTLTADVNEKILSAVSGIAEDSKSVLSKDQLVPAMEFLRTIAALCGYTGFVISGVNEAGCSETEEQLVVWLRRLISRQDIFHTSLRQSSTYSEVLLLFGLLLNNNNQITIRNIIVNTLDLDVPCFVRNISASRKLFIQKVFTCQGWIYRQICESVRPLHPLMLEFLETYTTNALAQIVGLANSQIIGAGGGCVPFTEAELFSQFSDPVFGPDARMCAPGATDFVAELPIDSDVDDLQMDLTPQLLFLYYMFYIHDQELASRGAENRGNQRGTQTKLSLSLFSDKLWDAIPITYLLQYARSNISSYRQLYPRLQLLVMEYRPHLVVGEFTIQDELLLDPIWKPNSDFQPFNSFCPPRRKATAIKAPLPDKLLSVLDQILSPSSSLESLKSATIECISAVNSLVKVVNGLRGFSRLRHLLPYAEAIGCRLPRVLLETAALSGNQRFSSAVCFLWRSLHCIMPCSRHFVPPTSTTASEEPETSSAASATPLSLVPITAETEMQSLARGRRTSGNARPTLEPVSGAGVGGTEGSAASSSQPNTAEPLASDELCDRLRTTLVACQDATVVQILLEFCLPTAKEKNLKSEVTELRQVQNIICTFIHFLFIGDPDLAKVVFWQTYPRSLNPLATRAIPSIQICTDTVLEIFLKSGSLEDVTFCLDFVSHLALHCPFNAVHNLATYAVEVMGLIFTHLASLEEMAPLLVACGPAFCRLACAFPSFSHRLAAILLSAMSTLSQAVAVIGGSRHRDLLVKSIVALKSSALSGFDDALSKSLDLVEDGAESLPNLSHLTRTERYTVACVHAMLCFNRLVRLTTPQRRLYLAPGIDELPSLLTWQPLPSVYSFCHSEK
ncbi:unnamed protein product [Hydatigera taeniaeformis]|uniref:Integrator complex subunit 2 n=1 Tax=Hydatigena taeniaeformis TaxID=6205 RepID=A0A0R3X8Q2_HYDTA|nr:unnamed protein product [Hydatigera taeniaeformis]